jgi:hypothetical protein
MRLAVPVVSVIVVVTVAVAVLAVSAAAVVAVIDIRTQRRHTASTLLPTLYEFLPTFKSNG